MSFAQNRLSKELLKLEADKDQLEGIIINKTADIMILNAILYGPPNTPYENGKFDVVLKFDSDYPVKPPSVKFLTPMYHPNIYRDGKICIDILQNEWSPSQNIRTILLSIRSLLMDPNPASPANRDAAILYNKNKTEYEEKVRDFIKSNCI